MLFALAAVVALTSCEQDNTVEGNNLAPVITQIYLQDGQSENTIDRPVVFARLGQTIRIGGQNLLNVVKVYINGYDTMFNQTLMSEESMIVQINSRVPVMDADPAVRNTIRVVKRDGKETTFEFEIRASMPTVSAISHTLAQAGEKIRITGSNMHEASEVIFPGSIAGEVLAFDEDGEWVDVIVPEGIATSGSVSVVGANGTATSAPFFNFKQGILHNFDDVVNNSWSAGMENPIIEVGEAVAVPADASLPKSQGRFHTFNSGGNLGSADQRYWLNSSNCIGIMAAIPGSTMADMCGIQMDIFVEGAWNSGIIRMTMVDGMGDSRGCMVYTPIYPGYQVTADGVSGEVKTDAFVNPGCWFTITMPFSLAASDFAGKPLMDITGAMAGAAYLQCGPWFDNKIAQLPTGAQAAATQKIYFDNVRIVPLEAPVATDYPEDEEGEEGGQEGGEEA